MRTTEVRAHADAWIEEAFPGKHHGSSSRLRLSGTTANRRRAFLHFARPFPVGGSVISATLHLTAHSWGTHQLDIDRVTGDWNERQVNWNNQPAIAGAGTVSTTFTAADKDEQLIDLTTMFEGVAVGTTYRGLRLATPDNFKGAFYAAEHPIHGFRPWLEVQWAFKPEPPRDGAPAGNHAISKASGILDYRFGPKGSDPDQRQDAINVQVATSTDFTTPAFDSGWVTDDKTLYDLANSGPTYSVPLGSTRWWRARARDADGLVSDWSDKWQFQRIAQGSLVLNNPSGAAVVHDLTPPVSWTLTGATQAQFEVLLFKKRNNGTWKRIWHMPRHKSTDTSINIPAGKIKSGATYLVKVRTWDTVDRQSVPNDPKFLEVQQQFTYSRDGTPAAVSSLSADLFGPGVALSWHDNTEPDYYSIRVNGVEVIPRLEPIDVAVGGGDYAYLYLRGEHGNALTFEVERVVNSAGNLFHSGTNPDVTATPNVEGKWLFDEDPATPLGIQIVGQEQMDLAIGDSGETLNPLNWRKQVYLRDAFRGFEGSYSGVLKSTDAANNFLELIGRNKKLRYIVQHLNIPVEFSEPSLSPKSDAQTMDLWTCGLNIWQAGEFFDVEGLDDGDEDD